jgi:hypothetical protein
MFREEFTIMRLRNCNAWASTVSMVQERQRSPFAIAKMPTPVLLISTKARTNTPKMSVYLRTTEYEVLHSLRMYALLGTSSMFQNSLTLGPAFAVHPSREVSRVMQRVRSHRGHAHQCGVDGVLEALPMITLMTKGLLHFNLDSTFSRQHNFLF